MDGPIVIQRDLGRCERDKRHRLIRQCRGLLGGIGLIDCRVECARVAGQELACCNPAVICCAECAIPAVVAAVSYGNIIMRHPRQTARQTHRGMAACFLPRFRDRYNRPDDSPPNRSNR